MPKIVDKKEKRTKILEAAITVFAKRGIAKTKMTDSAEAAQSGKGTIYEYFHSKNQMFIDAFFHVMKKTEDIFKKRIASKADPIEKLRSLFDAWKEVFSSDFKDYMEIVLDFWAEGIRNKDEAATFSLKKIYADNRRITKDILDEGVAKGKFKPMNTQIVASIILGAMDGEMVQWITDPHIFELEESFDTMFEIILKGIKK